MINGEKMLKERRKKIKFRNNINVNIYKTIILLYKKLSLNLFSIFTKNNFLLFSISKNNDVIGSWLRYSLSSFSKAFKKIRGSVYAGN
jgi:hypothetical protein